ncbi:MAG: PqqD family protein [Actinomycetota bacterium]
MSSPLICRSSGFLARRVGEELLLAAPERDDFQSLSGTAALLWDLLVSPHTLEQVAATLAQLYRADETRIRADIDVAITELIRFGYLEELTGEPPPSVGPDRQGAGS